MDLPFEIVEYNKIISEWPSSGKHILASSTESTIVLYQAYNHKISTYATSHGTFKGCPHFSETRMTWLKPNFLWMMYRSGWGTKENQENILAITVTRTGFEEILSHALRKGDGDVRLQWDPDHDPYGDKLDRRAIQLGIRGQVLQKFLNEWIISITNISDFVSKQRIFVERKELDNLFVPKEIVYVPSSQDVCNIINLDK